MNYSTIKLWICLIVVLIPNNHALRCRSGNQQINDEIEKVMLKCKRHNNSESGRSDSNSSSADESSEEDSLSTDGNIFNKEFFSNPRKKVQDNTKNSGYESSYSSRRNDSNSYRQQSATRMREIRHQLFNSNNNDEYKRNGMRYQSQMNNDEDHHGYSCSAQCFFEELNSVNQRGFPERVAVTRLLLRGIQNPILRDFIEESILECFHFLQSEMNNKCIFSQNLLICLADKGRERCEDWYD
ncbi:hypothetical protein PV327_003727 [Microctonus hyperodae]|uniref:Uncharacterized protein n=1 Tax=Microctonus hyperodae TaxID=165561 RepID=A0AA39G4J9_MICHY|nr:hypothetical protein PV327_003727 [Microctonus hyperodae]